MKVAKIILLLFIVALLLWGLHLEASYTVDQRIGPRAERCRIVGDHETVTGNCIPYCPPHPSECG